MNSPPSDELPLYREEALASQKTGWAGEVIFASPLSYKFMAGFATTVIIALAALAIFGTYTKKNTVIGQIVPDAGIVKIYAPQPGTIIESHVTEGMRVHKGDVLFVISSDRFDAKGQASQADISSDAEARKQLVSSELSMTGALQVQDKDALQRKVDNYLREVGNINSQMDIQRNRTAVAQDIAARYQQLLAAQYVSQADAQEKKAEFLDQQARLADLEREKTSTLRDLESAKSDLADLPLKSGSSMASLQREFRSADEELSESESKRSLTIVAPRAGTATAIIGQVGQTLATNQALVSILPDNSKMQAYLYASTKTIGFVKPGDAVEMRYEAYPYQRYGVYTGIVSTISRNALAPDELNGPESVLMQRAEPEDRGAPLYRITVSLDSQDVKAYGKSEHLQAGMLLEADILQDSRRLYQWILEPLDALDLPEADLGEKEK